MNQIIININNPQHGLVCDGFATEVFGHAAMTPGALWGRGLTWVGGGYGYGERLTRNEPDAKPPFIRCL